MFFYCLTKHGLFGDTHIHSGCGEVVWLRGKYRTTSEAITKNAITAIILLILRSFQRKGLCNSDLKAKSTTFAFS